MSNTTQSQAEHIKSIIRDLEVISLIGGWAQDDQGRKIKFMPGTQVDQTISDFGRTIKTVYAYDDGSELVSRTDLSTDTVSFFCR